MLNSQGIQEECRKRAMKITLSSHHPIDLVGFILYQKPKSYRRGKYEL